MGADNWSFAELLALPDVLLQGLATFLNLVELEDFGPPRFALSLLPLSPKKALPRRPIYGP